MRSNILHVGPSDDAHTSRETVRAVDTGDDGPTIQTKPVPRRQGDNRNKGEAK